MHRSSVHKSVCFINVSLNGLGEISYCSGFKLQTSGELNLIMVQYSPSLALNLKTSFNHQVLKLLRIIQQLIQNTATQNFLCFLELLNTIRRVCPFKQVNYSNDVS